MDEQLKEQILSQINIEETTTLNKIVTEEVVEMGLGLCDVKCLRVHISTGPISKA